jgi:hypothetical protein
MADTGLLPKYPEFTHSGAKPGIGHTLTEDILMVTHIACPSAGQIIVVVKVAELMHTSC